METVLGHELVVNSVLRGHGTALIQSLTLARIRTNAAIRQGIALVSTEAAAADWLSCFGSSPRPIDEIEHSEIPTLLLGGLRRLRFGKSLFLKLSTDSAPNKAWLRQIERFIGYGDNRFATSVLVIGFSQRGLRKLGLKDDHIKTFSVAFQQGSAAPERALALGDIGDSDPKCWAWGSETSEVDVVLLAYADDPTRLEQLLEQSLRLQLLPKQGDRQEPIYEIEFTPLPEGSEPVREPFGFVDGISDPVIRGVGRWTLQRDRNHLVEPGEFILGYRDNSGYLPSSPILPTGDDPTALLPALAPDPARAPSDPPQQRPAFDVPQSADKRDFGFNGTYLVIRHLEQDTRGFTDFLNVTAKRLAGDPRLPQLQAPLSDWIAAKMLGRWQDGASLVRNPNGVGSTRKPRGDPDNDFLFGLEDPNGLRCPFGAHIRRANPRDSFNPGAAQQLSITNRHRILRVGRRYDPQKDLPKPGLVFMCLNADIERQFEFVQQTWIQASSFQGLQNEINPIAGHGTASHFLTIPTPGGPLRVGHVSSENPIDIKDFVTVRGSGYFFLPGKKAFRFLSTGL